MRRLPARLALFYAAFFAGTGVQLPFWPVWLAARGLSADQIALLLTLGQWLKLATNPLIGIAADRDGARRVLVALGLGALAAYGLLAFVAGFPGILLLATAAGLCAAGQLPLGDSLALAAAYEGRLDYGRVRLWGSLGFIVAALIAGRMLDGFGAAIVLPLTLAAAALTLGSCLTLPERAARPRPKAEPGRWRGYAHPRFIAFLGAASLIQGSHSVYYGFGTLYWQSLGLADATISLLWAEGVVAEVMLFYWGAPLLRRIGPLGLVALAGAAGVARWTAMTLLVTPAALAMLQLLHALTFAAAHLGAMHYLARSVAAEQAATAQSVYTAVVGGIGGGLLMLVAGRLYGGIGGGAYLAMAALAGIGAALAALLAATKS